MFPKKLRKKKNQWSKKNKISCIKKSQGTLLNECPRLSTAETAILESIQGLHFFINAIMKCQLEVYQQTPAYVICSLLNNPIYKSAVKTENNMVKR